MDPYCIAFECTDHGLMTTHILVTERVLFGSTKQERKRWLGEIRRVELGQQRVDKKYRCAETMKRHNETTNRKFCPRATFVGQESQSIHIRREVVVSRATNRERKIVRNVSRQR